MNIIFGDFCPASAKKWRLPQKPMLRTMYVEVTGAKDAKIFFNIGPLKAWIATVHTYAYIDIIFVAITGPNPTTLSYYASGVKIYIATK
jgi:hypothetical protein